MAISCDCNKDCVHSMWFELDTYLWARYNQPDGSSNEMQIFKFTDLNKLVEFRDMINEVILNRVGIGGDKL